MQLADGCNYRDNFHLRVHCTSYNAEQHGLFTKMDSHLLSTCNDRLSKLQRVRKRALQQAYSDPLQAKIGSCGSLLRFTRIRSHAQIMQTAHSKIQRTLSVESKVSDTISLSDGEQTPAFERRQQIQVSESFALRGTHLRHG